MKNREALMSAALSRPDAAAIVAGLCSFAGYQDGMSLFTRHVFSDEPGVGQWGGEWREIGEWQWLLHPSLPWSYLGATFAGLALGTASLTLCLKRLRTSRVGVPP